MLENLVMTSSSCKTNLVISSRLSGLCQIPGACLSLSRLPHSFASSSLSVLSESLEQATSTTDLDTRSPIKRPGEFCVFL